MVDHQTLQPKTMRISYLFVLAAFLVATSCQKESLNGAANSGDNPIFQGRTLIVTVVSTNPEHCAACNHQWDETTPQPMPNARVAIYDPSNFKQGDVLPLASFDSDRDGMARFNDLDLEAYEVVVVYGEKEYRGSSETPENKITQLTIEMD